MRLILRWIEPGDVPQVVTDSPDLEVMTVSEFAPGDRVYELSSLVCRVSSEALDALLADDRIGRLGDMPGAEAKVLRYLNGEPEPRPRAHLSVVPPPT